MQKRPRQTDVAKLAGVSPATVSVILNNRLDGNVRISAETRARVLDAVEQLGYVTDPVARSLAGGRNSLLGVFAFDEIFPPQQRNLRYSFLVGIEHEAAKLGYDLLLFTSNNFTSNNFTSNNNADEQRRIYQGNMNRLRMADGAILLGSAGSQEELNRLVADQYPFVFIGRPELSDAPLSYVAADYTTATAQIVHEMLVQGHRRIIYVGMLHNNTSYRERYAGYLMAYRQMGLAQLAVPAQRLSATALTVDMIQRARAEGATAFVLESEEELLVPFFQALDKLKLHAPVDLSLGLLGDSMADWNPPYPLTSFAIPREAMGRRAVHLLFELLQASPAQRASAPQVLQEILPCTHLPGVTIGPPKESPL
ncbi:MAG: LacI family DNA-binding transcriptional regulator [Caldilineaceae bacterium]|nr:LacI family DNA-binding transcriptional regulator [Caldilineaceae bacterium]